MARDSSDHPLVRLRRPLPSSKGRQRQRVLVTTTADEYEAVHTALPILKRACDAAMHAFPGSKPSDFSFELTLGHGTIMVTLNRETPS